MEVSDDNECQKLLQRDFFSFTLCNHLTEIFHDTLRHGMEIKMTEEDPSQMRVSLENSDTKKTDLHFSNGEFDKKLAASLQETKKLKEVADGFAAKLSDLDQQFLVVSGNNPHICSVYDLCSKIAEQEKHLLISRLQKFPDQIQELEQELQSASNENVKLKEGEKVRRRLEPEFDSMMTLCNHLTETMAELARQLHDGMEINLTKDGLSRMRVLVENMERTKTELQNTREFARKLTASLQETKNLEEVADGFAAKLYELDREYLAISGNISQLYSAYDLCSKIAEQEKHLLKELLQTRENAKYAKYLAKKRGQADRLQKATVRLKRRVKSLETCAGYFRALLEQKQSQSMEKEKELEDEKLQIRQQLGEAEKRYDSILKSLQSELPSHQKEFSEWKDEEMKYIKKKYEDAKQEIVNVKMEKKKVEELHGVRNDVMKLNVQVQSLERSFAENKQPQNFNTRLELMMNMASALAGVIIMVGILYPEPCH